MISGSEDFLTLISSEKCLIKIGKETIVCLNMQLKC